MHDLNARSAWVQIPGKRESVPGHMDVRLMRLGKPGTCMPYKTSVKKVHEASLIICQIDPRNPLTQYGRIVFWLLIPVDKMLP